MLINSYTRFGLVEGLGDARFHGGSLHLCVISPHRRKVRGLRNLNFVAAHEPVLSSLTRRIGETAAVARVAAHIKGNDALSAGVNATLAAEIDEFCGTPPRPHRLDQAALAVSLIAASLEANDPAKMVLVNQAERLQQKLQGQQSAAA